MRRAPQITSVVFDLDDTLYDCYRQRVLVAHRYACRKMLAAGLRKTVRHRLSLDQLLRQRLELFHRKRDLETLDRRLCRRLGIRGPQARRIARLGRQAYFSYPVRSLHLFADTLPTLRRLHRAGVKIFVLTAGLGRIQRAKVHVLGLDRRPEIEAIFFTGLLQGRGKRRWLRRALDQEPDPQRVLVVGDRADSEIRAARALGMWTVRRIGGEFAQYRPRTRHERAHFTIRRLSDLFRLGFQFGKDEGTTDEHS